jgi:RNA recognition motif-containing protein
MHNASEDTGHGKISTQQPLTGKVVSNAVFVGGLPNFYEDADLGRALEQFGRVTKASVQRDTQGVSRCFGIVSFEDQSSASRALSAQVCIVYLYFIPSCVGKVISVSSFIKYCALDTLYS